MIFNAADARALCRARHTTSKRLDELSHRIKLAAEAGQDQLRVDQSEIVSILPDLEAAGYKTSKYLNWITISW